MPVPFPVPFAPPLKALLALALLAAVLSVGCAKKVLLPPDEEPTRQVQAEERDRNLPTAEEFATGKRHEPELKERPLPEAQAPARRPASQEIALAAPAAKPYQEEGQAGRYGDEDQGRTLASGETYDREALTAAHRILPMGTKAEVVSLENGKSVVVTVNDRGPFKDADKRIVDLSQAAAEGLGMAGDRPVRVRLRTLGDIPGAGTGDIPGAFYVQVGSYTIRANAEKILADLREGGYPQSRIVESGSGGKTFHRVQAGVFRGLASAREAQEKLRLAYPGSLILTD